MNRTFAPGTTVRVNDIPTYVKLVGIYDSALIQHHVASAYGVKKIIYNDPATIVFWKDGTKTVVKCAKGEKFNEYTAFCAALAKKVYGTNSRVTKIVKSGEEHKWK